MQDLAHGTNRRIVSDMRTILRAAAARQDLNLSQAAQRIEFYTGAGRRTVRRWLDGTGTPSAEFVPGLCRALALEPNELFGWPDSGVKADELMQKNLEQRQSELAALAGMGRQEGGTMTTTRRRTAKAS